MGQVFLLGFIWIPPRGLTETLGFKNSGEIYVDNKKKILIVSGGLFTLIGVFLYQFRGALAVAILDARAFGGMPFGQEDAGKFAIFVIVGAVIFLIGLLLIVIGIFKRGKQN